MERDNKENIMFDIKEIVENINAGIPCIHVCGDDYSQIDKFVGAIARELQFDVIEWNMGYGQVDYKTKASSEVMENKAENQNGANSPAESLKFMYNTFYSNRKLLFIKNARLAFAGENNSQNLAQLQQTLFHIKKHIGGTVGGKTYKAAIIYSDEKRFIPDEIASMVYLAELKPPAREELELLVDQFQAANSGVEISTDTKERLTSTCVGMSEDIFVKILKRPRRTRKPHKTKSYLRKKRWKSRIRKKSSLLIRAASLNICRRLWILRKMSADLKIWYGG
jgi:hypothetical protein